MSKITDNIFLGNYYNAMNYQWLAGKKITHVLNCAKEIPCTYNKKLIYKHIKGNDIPTFKLLPYLHEAADFINEVVKSKGRVLVHCAAGISRSTTCLIAYFMKYRNTQLMPALQFIRTRRTIVRPNPGFMSQLQVFSKLLTQQKQPKQDVYEGKQPYMVQSIAPNSIGNRNMENSGYYKGNMAGQAPQFQSMNEFGQKQPSVNFKNAQRTQVGNSISAQLNQQNDPTLMGKKPAKKYPKSILKKGGRPKTTMNTKNTLNTVDQLTNALNFGYDPTREKKLAFHYPRKMQKTSAMLLEEIDTPKDPRELRDPKSTRVNKIAHLSGINSEMNPQYPQINPQMNQTKQMNQAKQTDLQKLQNSELPTNKQPKLKPKNKFKVKRGSKSLPRQPHNFTLQGNALSKLNKHKLNKAQQQKLNEQLDEHMKLLYRKPPLIVNNTSNHMQRQFRTTSSFSNNNSLYNRYLKMGTGQRRESHSYSRKQKQYHYPMNYGSKKGGMSLTVNGFGTGGRGGFGWRKF